MSLACRPSKTASGMASLPEEILLLILTHFRARLKEKKWNPCREENFIRYRSLARVCRVSKTWRRIALPVLYHTVELPGPIYSEQPPFDCELPRTKWNVKLFFRTILWDPGLAQLVRRLKVESWGSEEENFPRAFDSWPTDVRLDLLNRLHNWLPLSNGLQAEINHRTLKHYDDGMVAMLVPLCGKLEYLDISLCQDLRCLPESLLMRTIDEIARSSCRTWQFSKLKCVKFRQIEAPPFFLGDEYPHQDEGFQLLDASPFLRLPQLKAFKSRGAGRPFSLEPRPGKFQALAPDISSLSSIHLIWTTVRWHELVDMLIALPQLRHLHYVEREYEQTELPFHSVFEALRKYGRGLTHLRLHAVNSHHAPGDLKPLTQLWYLSITQRGLFGAYDPDVQPETLPELTDILPESLGKLRIIPFGRSYPPFQPGPPPPPDDGWDLEHTVTDFGYAFDERLTRLCRDKRFKNLYDVNVERGQEIEVMVTPRGWNARVDVAHWMSLRRGEYTADLPAMHKHLVTGYWDPVEGEEVPERLNAAVAEEMSARTIPCANVEVRE